MEIQTYLFIAFAFIITIFLVADLGYFNRRAHKVDMKSALLQSIFWVAVSLAFAVLILIYMGEDLALQFLSAYVTEKMLSVDNLFVILLIFNFFKLDEKYHHRALFWGILGAIVFRGIFITAGSLIVSQFHWVLYIFGVILIYTGFKLFEEKKEEHINFHENKVLKFAHKYLSFTNSPHEGKFMLRENGKWHFTLLFMIVLLVETTDIVFAVDSIPAAFAITQNPFILYTSNIFAVMGLRALFFLIENVMHRFHHLQKGLSLILIFIGGKMFAGIFHIEISSFVSFAIVMSALVLSLVLSIYFPKKI
ncbi:MAG: Integral membrane protein TerC [Parcubacteria group bacterium GW2011_GWF2_38_76]|nr:MAG: Integral membrane protein TerC [Parcubacteria group bacterium GW2011_GWF2_38_76]HBM45815.1 tellurium resistance protein TerC [Patescibacteria group bacterium]